jgi:hypothetical protein
MIVEFIDENGGGPSGYENDTRKRARRAELGGRRSQVAKRSQFECGAPHDDHHA